MIAKTNLFGSLIKNWYKAFGYVSGRFVRIASLKPSDRAQMTRHLQSLSQQDRYYRFGFSASDQQIQDYVNSLNFERDHIFGIYGQQGDLVAMAHVAHLSEVNHAPLSFGLGCSERAEFGVSVLPEYRSKGYGGRLFSRAVTYARNQGVSEFHIQALTENARMLRIAKKHGATLEQHGSETEAYLLLPSADLDSQLSEMVAEYFGEVDYALAHTKTPRKARALQGV